MAKVAYQNEDAGEALDRVAELEALLRRAEPALWLLATGGHAEAVQIHRDVRAALAK